MIRDSPELAAIARRWVDAMNRRDYETVAALFLRSEHSRYIGSDSHEWWRGPAYIDAYSAHQEEMPDYVIEVEELEAFETGQFGWAAIRTLTTFVGLAPRPLRFTFVFVLDSGFWRISQTHLSFAVPNPEVMGVEMTKSLEDLLASVRPELEESIRAVFRQGTVTLVFTDIESSTELAGQIGDAAWATVVDWHDRTIRDVVESRGGTLVKTLGDGAMAAFDSVRQAARSALAIQQAFGERNEQPILRTRVGIHVGDVVVTEDDYLGTTVNKAARIAAAAQGGEIIASDTVRSLLADDPEFRFEDPQTVRLKGIEGVHEVARLIAAE